MNVFGITGWKNSGKTTLVVNVVGALKAKGYSVSTIKHAHHAFDIDQPGKDSFLHRDAGATEVLVASSQRWALMSELREESEPDLPSLLEKLSPVDIVIVEGFKRSPHAKIAVIRPEHNAELLPDAQPIVAIASDQQLNPTLYGCNGPVFKLNDIDAIVNFIIEYCDL